MIVLKLIAVFGLLGFTLWWIRRYDTAKMARGVRGDRPVEIIGQARIGKTTSVALVRVGDTTFTLGVTEQQVTLLSSETLPVPAPAIALSLEAAAKLEEAEALLASSAPMRPTFGEAIREQLTSRRMDGSMPSSARMPQVLRR